MKRLAIVGAHGRMGQAVDEAAGDEFEVVGKIVRPGSASKKHEFSSLTDVQLDLDVVVDISAPKASLEALEWCIAHGVPFVSGTTGFSEEQLVAFDSASTDIPVLLASNFSVGVNILERLVELAARATDGWDVEVFEAHHRDKVDAPSGTALTLGEAAARGMDTTLGRGATWTRHGRTGPRESGSIGFQVLRGGSIVGEHTVFMCGDGERIELTHRATDRGIFARGAVRAAAWICDKPPGRYTMTDVLF